jgi:hypothetical protein
MIGLLYGSTALLEGAPVLTNTDLPTAQADITHRNHAIIETVFADLVDGPLAHMPSGRFGGNSAWTLCAAIAHNLLRAAGVLAGGPHAVVRGATLRRKIVNIPARTVTLRANPSCICPHTGAGQNPGLHCGATQLDSSRQQRLPPDQLPRRPDQGITGKAGQTSSYPLRTAKTDHPNTRYVSPAQPISGSRLR